MILCYNKLKIFLIKAVIMSEKKEKKYIIDNPVLMAEWNWEKNNELGLDHKTLTLGSSKKVWWICPEGHAYSATVSNRTNGNGCPYCSGLYAIKGETDLVTLNPKLASQWNYGKNSSLDPSLITVSSGKKVWWKCEEGHEWMATIASRTNGNNCPYCSWLYAIKGQTDLAALNPKLASEWNYEKNGDLKPENFTVNSGQKVWWKCENSHEWQAVIYNRNKGRGCPICSNKQILKGFYPTPNTQETDLQLFYGSYLSTYVERDVRQVKSIQKSELTAG